MNPRRELLCHALTTVVYRGRRAIEGAPEGFATFAAGGGARTPQQILAHIGDLFEWSLWLAKGHNVWHEAAPLAWDREVERFYATIAAFDSYLSTVDEIACPDEKLLQGPIADALTHVGQLVILRRMEGSPVKRENYFRADMSSGRLAFQRVTRPRDDE